MAKSTFTGGSVPAATTPPTRAPPNSSEQPQTRFTSNLVYWILVLLSIPVAILAYNQYGNSTFQAVNPLDFKARAEYLMSTTPLIDGHNDLPYLLRLELKNRIYDGRFGFREGLASHTDLERMKKGRVGGQFWSVFVECPDTPNLDDPNHAVRDTLEQIDVAKRFIAEYPELEYCETSSCVMPAFKSGKIPSMLGAEGLHQAGSAIAVIRQFHSLGVRYITLTHNCDNAFATAASTITSRPSLPDAGLTKFGIEAVKEMNRMGMMVDLSHTSHQTMRDVLSITQSPVMFSHTAAYALAGNYRNVPDDVLKMVGENGGVVMVFFVKRFLDVEDPEGVGVERAVDHVFWIAEKAGWGCVGIGADFDGTVTLANGIDGVSAYPVLIEAILRRGATDEQVRGLLGENILRVWAENERVAARLQDVEGMKPVEEVWEERSWTRWDNPLPVMIPGNGERIRAKNHE